MHKSENLPVARTEYSSDLRSRCVSGKEPGLGRRRRGARCGGNGIFVGKAGIGVNSDPGFLRFKQ